MRISFDQAFLNQLMSHKETFFVGDRVTTTDNKIGEVKYIGKYGNNNGIYIGVEFDESFGDHNGIVNGIKYWKGKDNHCSIKKQEIFTKILDRKFYINLMRGYSIAITKRWIPKIIIILINSFFDIKGLISLKLWNNNFYKMSQNKLDISSININRDSYYYLTENKDMYVSGENGFGQLGVGTNINVDLLIKNKYINNIKWISNGIFALHCFVYTSNNILYGFGLNKNNQIGITNNDDILLPVKIEYNFDSRIKDIKTGEFHTLILSFNGYVYGCGRTLDGQLTKQYIEYSHIGITKLKEFEDIIYIGCARYTSYVLHIDGTLFTFGDNRHGELGTILSYVILYLIY